MSNTQERFQEVFNELYPLSIENKIIFLQLLLFHFTIMGRGIWSDEKSTDSNKMEAFKWLNELAHRIWNIIFELRQCQDNDSISRLYENMKFYSDQSSLLRMHLLPTFLGAFENFEVRS
jgi:hypothetical protein